MASPNFDIHLSDYSSSLEDWNKAEKAPLSELPDLSDEERELAQKLGLSEDEYRRHKLVGEYGQERLLTRARALGERVQAILEGARSEYKLSAIFRNVDGGLWILRLEGKADEQDVSISWELADDLLDSGGAEYEERFKNKILSALAHRQ